MSFNRENEPRISEQLLAVEMGIGSIEAEVCEQADLISQKWQLPELRPENPAVLMLGGFQGAGKTTVLDALNRDREFLVISPDEVRYNLFAQKYPFSEQFVKLVNATKFELVRRALEMGYSASIDQAITPDRVMLTKKLVVNYPRYKLVTVFLRAPFEVLQQRVEQRQALPGRYKGTVDELRASIEKYVQLYGMPDQSSYDLLIDVEAADPVTIAEVIRSKLS
jgi:cytidylate kinase